MEMQTYQRKNKLKLRILTSTGLNLLCTANRSQKVRQLLPHIIKLYQQVKEDQGFIDGFKQTLKPSIKSIRKEGFLIAQSQTVGDIFDENDEVFCQMLDDINFNTKNAAKIEKSQQDIQIMAKKENIKDKNQNQKQPQKSKHIKKQAKKSQHIIKKPEPTKSTHIVTSQQKINTKKPKKNKKNGQKIVQKIKKSQQLIIEQHQTKENTKLQKESKPVIQLQQVKDEKSKQSKVENVKSGQNGNKKKSKSKPVDSINKSQVKVGTQKASTPLISKQELLKFKQLLRSSKMSSS